MALKLYYHPLASFCWKPLIALYENETPFEPVLVDLGNPESRAAFLSLWPIGKFPLLHDDTRDQLVPESSIIIEYLSQHYPGPSPLVPIDPELAREARLLDRFYDCYVMDPMQKIVGDRLRPDGQHDPFGVTQAQAALRTSYALTEQALAGKSWAMGERFSLADCAAAPALYYANKVVPLTDAHPITAAYLNRLSARPSFARVLSEAAPYFGMFPADK